MLFISAKSIYIYCLLNSWCVTIKRSKYEYNLFMLSKYEVKNRLIMQKSIDKMSYLEEENDQY
jgi:hypothetical protein